MRHNKRIALESIAGDFWPALFSKLLIGAASLSMDRVRIVMSERSTQGFVFGYQDEKKASLLPFDGDSAVLPSMPFDTCRSMVESLVFFGEAPVATFGLTFRGCNRPSAASFEESG